MVQAKNQALLDIVQPIIEDQNLLLWDLIIKKVAGKKTVEILVDLPNHDNISMTQITTFTQAVNEALDEAEVDPVPGEYMLDIASPGWDRSLSEPWHFEWAKEADEQIAIALFAAKDGQKKWTGSISSLDDAGLTLDVDGEEKRFNFDEIAKAVVSIQF
ncbi:ribosome maturation factor RimP [Fructobacillus sp. M2-14]|uniref:Ribosome maturation factor RimP n=1 Tax=Fructobacillus broussonetiae TaxID=2713173 RepID=A0ABS5R0A3_9LACO|nr:ribosome maturation factor RimP [Fructobacillus broussonetiae]MBS9338056.1 ribosome maturation factor RimP [Fructobacillus broussonetiae]